MRKNVYMTSIIRATEKDYITIINIGKESVTEAHKDSCDSEILNEFIERNYNDDAIKKELSEQNNIYYIINYNDQPIGFSKIIFNVTHPNIARKNIAKLDRIYLLKEFHGIKLGFELLKFNIELSKSNNQSGLWLFTWTGNKRAIDFYLNAGFTIIGSHNFHVAKTHYNPNHHMFLDFSKNESK
jgi:GNAT superfamily N-acetyltransferase